MTKDEKRKLFVLENAPPAHMRLAKELLAHPKHFSAPQIVQALNAIGKHGPKGPSAIEPAPDNRQALFAAGATSAAQLLGKDVPEIPQAFHDTAPSSFDPALYQAGAESAKVLKQFMRSAR